MLKTSKKIINETFKGESIIKSMPDLAFVFNKEGRLVTWNKNVEIVTGYSKEELDIISTASLIYEPDRERVLNEMLKIVARDETAERTIEYGVLTKSGKAIPHLAFRTLVTIDAKEYIIGIATNISKIKKDSLRSRSIKIEDLKIQLLEQYREIERINQDKIELEEKLFLNTKRFYQELFSKLPGIFYLYEKVGDKFFLKKCNNNYELDLGYSLDEIYNWQPHQFFTDKEYKKAEEAIMQIFTAGSVQVEIYTTHKNGRQIPYFYEGFLFEDSGRSYFMGVGIDISSQYALKKQQKWQKKEKKKAQLSLEANKRELVATALYISKTDKKIIDVQKKIDKLREKYKESSISDDLNTLKKSLILQSSEQDNWEVFKLQLTEVHKHFFSKLTTKHPALTKSEIKFCAYLHIHLSSSQISSVLNISKEGIKKARYRIRKKLNLTPKDSLEDYISKF